MKVSFAVVARILSAAVQALLLLIVAREAEPSQLANLIALLAAMGFAATAIELGVARELTVVAAKGNGTEFSYLSRIHAAGCMAFVLLVSIVSFAIELGFLPAILAIYTAAERRISALMGATVAIGRLNTSSAVLIIGRLVLLTVYFSGLVVFPENPIGVYAGATAISSVMLATAFHLYSRPASAVSAERRTLRAILGVSLHFWAATMLGQLRSLDVVLVTALFPSSSAALYALPSRALQPMRLIGTSIAGTAFPIAASGDRARTSQLLRISALTSVVAALALGGLAPFLPSILTALIGAEYQSAAMAFVLMAIGAAINIPGAVLSSVLQAHGFQRAITLLGVLLTAFQFVSIVILAAAYGINGAAAAVPATFAIQLIVTTLIYRRLPRG
ncbi:hypothetical protein [Dietzia maris]|uniref:hypothetical protein n=1 Tax=Dietzia maris TaxID=37915 RepID=UPI00232BC9DD|nr:hypothetical protein [Dietzia maris]